EDCSVSMRQLRLQSKKDGQLGFDADGCFESNSYWLELSGTPTMEGTSKSIAATAAECQRHCSLAPGCGHFSFWHDGGCLLTSDSASSRQHGGVVSGPATCGAHGAAVAKPVFKEGEKNVSARAGLEPPEKATTYNGVAWETMKIPGKKEMHIFAIGDWGGLDGQLFGRANSMIQYRGGQTPGPHTMARFRGGGCTTPNMVDCFNGMYCAPACHYTPEVDRQAQQLVAQQFLKRARTSDPDYILNVGDNFYWGGVNTQCGHPMSSIDKVTVSQFNHIFEGIYYGPGMDGKPWFSVLGNHDWGGFQFNKAWDQQIAYTWASDRWRMPAPYWMQRVEYTDLGFSAEFFMLDSNAMDVKPMNADPEHNICGAMHNPAGATCGATGGPGDVRTCFKWMWDLWREEQAWLEQKLADSTADWQVAVTHFNCGHQAQWYKKLHQQLGLDLLVTGHTHLQAMFHNDRQLGGLTCFITGGGGGITSEGDPDQHKSSQYGFYDLIIRKETLSIESINHRGETLLTVHLNSTSIPTTTTTTTTTTSATTTTTADTTDTGAI
ncbi:unnamed protein product, partial [Polarella glacialis]